MLCKLAWGNVRRAGRDYLIYLLTLTLGVTVFYAFNTISMQVDLVGIASDAEGVATMLGNILGGLTVFLGAIMGFLMVYANNFIMRRRNKEFGLYQVLGMSRGQVARIMALETLIVSLAALAMGIALGVGLSQLMVFFTASLFKTQVANFRFIFSPEALGLTVECLAVIFAVTLVFNLRVVGKSRLTDLMSSGRHNEQVKTRNPWLSGAVCVIGGALIGTAYARLIRDGLPITATGNELASATTQFGITTLMVTVGTVLFFFGLSGLLLKLFQMARGVYWRGLNVFTLRQLSAKVNTVSFSMAVISMILFLAITSVTAGMSIVSAMMGGLERSNPVDFSQTLWYNGAESDGTSADGTPVSYTMVDAPLDLAAEYQAMGIDLGSVSDSTVQLDIYYPQTKQELLDANAPASPLRLRELGKQAGATLPAGLENSDVESHGLFVLRESQYNALLAYRGKPQVDLGSDGYLISCDMGESISNYYDKILAAGVPVRLGGHELRPAEKSVDVANSAIADSAMGSNPGTLVVPDEVVDDADLYPSFSSLLVNYKRGVSVEQGNAMLSSRTGTTSSEVREGASVPAFWGASVTRSEMFSQMNSINGTVSYLAIYIGFVLVIACAAILAIQQLSSVSDAGRSYRVLSELGCDMGQITRSVLAQQAVFFLSPLAVGAAHSVVALKVVIDLVKTFGGLTISGMVGVTCAIFLAAYGGYFLVTFAMSRGIVREAIRARKGE